MSRLTRTLLFVGAAALAACGSPVTVTDSGSATPDGGVTTADAGGTPDSGYLQDAGTGDAGSANDAGVVDDGGTASDAGSTQTYVPLSVASASLPQGIVGTAYLTTLLPRGGTYPYAWTLTAGALPIGLTLGGDGTLSGTPTQSGTVQLTVNVTDSSVPALQASASLRLDVFPTPSASNTFFVSPSGLDTNPGTLAQPWATLAHAQTAVRAMPKTAPIAVVLRAGTYAMPAGWALSSMDSGGSVSAPIFWSAYPNESPVVSGGFTVTGWQNVSGNLWQAALPATTAPFETLYYRGERRLRPRPGTDGGTNVGTFLRVASEVYAATPSAACPDGGFVPGQGYKCYDRFHYDPNDPVSSTWANLNPPAGNPCAAAPHGTAPAGDIEVDLFEAWTMEQMRVSCIDPVQHVLYFTGPTKEDSHQINFFGPTQGHRYVIENVKDLLTQPGQWFVDRSATPWTLNYLAQPGETPSSDTVVIPQAQPLVSATGVSWVVFHGLTFEVDDYVPGPLGFNDDVNGELTLPAAVDCEGCQDVLFDQISVRHTSANGIQVGTDASGNASARVTIQSSAFYDVGSSGIHLGKIPTGSDTDAVLPKLLVVQNNLVQGYARVFADGEGIASGAMQDVQLVHNDITDGYHAGISVCQVACPAAPSSRGTSNVASVYNRIWNILQGITSDGGSLYYNLGGAVRSGLASLIAHNIIHDVTDSSILDKGVKGSGYGGQGIYLDIETADADVEHNIVYRVSSAGIQISDGPAPGLPPNTFRNNIFAYPRASLLQAWGGWPQGCLSGGQALKLNMVNNITYFDRKASDQFYLVEGEAYSCGLPYDAFQQFVGNLYWRTDGTFATDPTQFHVDTLTPGNVETYTGGTPANWTFLTFQQWQTSATVDGQTQVMNEDPGGAIADPGFADPSYPSDDFHLSSAPVPGYIPAGTNDTLDNAGRTSSQLSPPAVPPTFPTASYDPVTDF